MNQQPVDLPLYSPDQFVNRKSEIDPVMEIADAVVRNGVVPKRAVIFVGERGTGKSWLLAHLRTQVEQRYDMTPFWLDLANYATRDPILAVKEILERFSRDVLSQPELPGGTPVEMSQNLMERLQPFLAQRALAVFVDWVYESDWRLLGVLEDYLLGPLALEPRVLIVMAGRGRPYPWKTLELRLRVEFIDLRPFENVAWTIDQLKRQKEEALPRAAEIHELSGGNPLANILLATHSDPAEGLGESIDGLLETIPSHRRQKVRESLEALCVLRSFDDARIAPMLAAYYDEPSYHDWTFAQAREIREELVDWAFARWSDANRGYVIDEPVRSLLERYLKTADRETWKVLQCAAYRLYQSWVERYPRAADRWQEEVEYHASRPDFSPQDCTASASQALADVIVPASTPI